MSELTLTRTLDFKHSDFAPALKDSVLPYAVLKHSGSPFKITDKLLAELPFNTVAALALSVFPSLEFPKQTLTQYRYTTDPFNLEYASYSSWVMPLFEGYSAKFHNEKTDMAGFYLALKERLAMIPCAWMKPFHIVNSASYQKMLESKDYEIVASFDREFDVWLVFKCRNKIYTYTHTIRPFTTYQSLRGAFRPPVAHSSFFRRLEAVKQQFCAVFLVERFPATDRYTYWISDLYYLGGHDFSNNIWEVRKKKLKRLSDLINVKEWIPPVKSHQAGKTVLFRHLDAKPFTFAYTNSYSPGHRWYQFWLADFKKDEAETYIQLDLFENGKMKPFCYTKIPTKAFSSYPFKAGMPVVVLAETLCSASQKICIYKIKPCGTWVKPDQLTITNLMKR